MVSFYRLKNTAGFQICNFSKKFSQSDWSTCRGKWNLALCSEMYINVWRYNGNKYLALRGSLVSVNKHGDNLGNSLRIRNRI